MKTYHQTEYYMALCFFLAYAGIIIVAIIGVIIKILTIYKIIK